MWQCILNLPLWNDWSKVTYLQVHGSPVLKLFYYKVSSEYLRQDSQSSYIFGNIVCYSFIQIQNVGETELSEQKIYCFIWERFQGAVASPPLIGPFHVLNRSNNLWLFYLKYKSFYFCFG